MSKKIRRNYSEVWKAKLSDNDTKGFDRNIKNLKNLYTYQRYHKNSDGKDGYDEKIIELIKGNSTPCEELKSNFLNKINWIALWKTNRIIEFNVGKENEIEKSLESLKTLKEDDDTEVIKRKSKEVFKSLLNESRGIQLAMASTIMHFYNPDVFPIIDKRAYRALTIILDNSSNNEIDISNITTEVETFKKLIPIKANTKDRVEKYYDYIKGCKELIKRLNNSKQEISMRNIDKFLYQIDALSGCDIKKIPIR